MFVDCFGDFDCKHHVSRHFHGLDISAMSRYSGKYYVITTVILTSCHQEKNYKQHHLTIITFIIDGWLRDSLLTPSCHELLTSPCLISFPPSQDG